MKYNTLFHPLMYYNILYFICVFCLEFTACLDYKHYISQSRKENTNFKSLEALKLNAMIVINCLGYTVYVLFTKFMLINFERSNSV